MVALISLLIVPAPATAQSPSLDQYVESVPTARGPKPSSHGSGPGGSELPPQVRRRIEQQGGSDADELAAIAGEPGRGAPQRPVGGREAERRGGSQRSAPGDDDKAALPSAAGAIGDGDGMAVLLVAGLATAVAIGGVALARRRRVSA